MKFGVRFLLHHSLTRLIREGSLTLVWPDGTANTYGDGGEPHASAEIVDEATIRRIAFQPGLAAGEAYMDGGFRPRGCTIHDVLDVLSRNAGKYWRNVPLMRLGHAIGRVVRPLVQANSAVRAKKNVAHHYDLNGRLYSLFLDRDRQYSCAYFPRGDETLEEAQAAKKKHIAAKLKLDRPGLSVLDIGCGWGGMALTLARDYGARVLGVTLSEEQLAEARSRAATEGLTERVRFELMDYRAITEQFDRIVSVGMFEHVGAPNYRTFFNQVKACLKPDGIALIHSIGRFDGPGVTNPWITKYIFPGGYSPALSETLAAVETTGLRVGDIEVLRLHYAKTLAHWRRRFNANRDAIATIYDERFCRMFEFYLSGSEFAFRNQDHMNFQIQLLRDQEAAPLARDYMFEAERATQSAGAVGG